jgi:hypothetical protein
MEVDPSGSRGCEPVVDGIRRVNVSKDSPPRAVKDSTHALFADSAWPNPLRTVFLSRPSVAHQVECLGLDP